jgi:hypothetical protein
MYMHRGIGILLQPQELQAGGWKADFALIDDCGSAIKMVNYDGTEVYPTREDAERAALQSASFIVDGDVEA